MTASITQLRPSAPAMSEYQAAVQAKTAAAQKVFDAMLKAMCEAEARCAEASIIDLPPGIRERARRLSEYLADESNGLIRINGNVGT